MTTHIRNTPLCALVALCLACQPTLTAEFQDLPVVEGYLYAGKPTSIRLSKLIPFRSDVVFAQVDIDALEVTLIDLTSNDEYILAPKGSGVYADSALLPQAGHSYQLLFWYTNELVSTTTSIADAPQEVAFSASNVYVPTMGGGFGGGGGSTMTPLTITWSNEAQDYYTVAVESEYPTYANYLRDSASYYDAPQLSFAATPTQDTILQLNAMQFAFKGRHRVRLCRIQAEYAAFFAENTSSNASSQLVEVHANVEGGFGIFTGISSVDTVITVSKQ
jgi:hypothetical protein